MVGLARWGVLTWYQIEPRSWVRSLPAMHFRCAISLAAFAETEVLRPDRWHSPHCWRKQHWYQHVSAGQQGAGTNVHEQDPAGTLVPARNISRH